MIVCRRTTAANHGICCPDICTFATITIAENSHIKLVFYTTETGNQLSSMLCEQEVSAILYIFGQFSQQTTGIDASREIVHALTNTHTVYLNPEHRIIRRINLSSISSCQNLTLITISLLEPIHSSDFVVILQFCLTVGSNQHTYLRRFLIDVNLH